MKSWYLNETLKQTIFEKDAVKSKETITNFYEWMEVMVNVISKTGKTGKPQTDGTEVIFFFPNIDSNLEDPHKIKMSVYTIPWKSRLI